MIVISIYLNGKSIGFFQGFPVSSDSCVTKTEFYEALDNHKFKFLTKKEYDLLSEDEQNNGTAYMITNNQTATDLDFDNSNNRLYLTDEYNSRMGNGIFLDITTDVNKLNVYTKPEIDSKLNELYVRSDSGYKYLIKVNDDGTLKTDTIISDIITDINSIDFVGISTKTLQIKLEKEPTNTQIVDISSSNPNVTVSQSQLTFNNNNYNEYQSVDISNTSSDSFVTSNITISSGEYSKVIKAETITIDQNGLIMWLDSSDIDGGSSNTTLKSRVSDDVLTLNNFKFDGTTDGWTGKTLKFTKSASNYATIPLPSSLLVRNSPITIQVVYKLGANLQSYGRAFAIDNCYFCQTNSSTVNAVGHIHGSSTISITNDFNILVIRLDSESNLSVFLNGTLVETKAINIPSSTQSIVLNNVYFNKEVSTQNPIDYELGSFLIYNKALTNEEILALYNYESSITR